MFPTELLSVRRDRKRGTVTPIFIGEDTENYASMVRDLFLQMKGKRKYEIQYKIRELELEVEHNKVIKGLAELLFRHSEFSEPHGMVPSELREGIFLAAPNGAARVEDRKEILDHIAAERNTTVEEIEKTFYADKEDEAILIEIADIPDTTLCEMYNLEQVETLILRSSYIIISEVSSWTELVSRIKRLGLFFTPQVDHGAIQAIRIDGPVSLLENSRRYASRLVLLVRSLLNLEEWTLKADATIKQEGKSELFTFGLNASSRYLFPQKDMIQPHWHPEWLMGAQPIFLGDTAYFPDFMTGSDKDQIYIDISRPEYADYNERMIRDFAEADLAIKIVYVITKKDKFKTDQIVYRDNVDFDDLQSLIDNGQHTQPIMKNKAIPVTKKKQQSNTTGTLKREERYDSLTDTILERHRRKKDADKTIEERVNALWPDKEEMLGLLEANNLDPAVELERMGYTVKWDGLDLKIIKRNF